MIFFDFFFYSLLGKIHLHHRIRVPNWLGAAPLSYSKLLYTRVAHNLCYIYLLPRLVLFSFEDMRAHAVHNFPLTNLAFYGDNFWIGGQLVLITNNNNQLTKKSSTSVPVLRFDVLWSSDIKFDGLCLVCTKHETMTLRALFAVRESTIFFSLFIFLEAKKKIPFFPSTS